MLATRISAVAFILLATYIVLGAVFLPSPPEGVAAVATAEGLVLNALGLAWFFALWAALVAGMVFLITWTSAGVVAAERARQRAVEPLTPAARKEAEDVRELARAG